MRARQRDRGWGGRGGEEEETEREILCMFRGEGEWAGGIGEVFMRNDSIFLGDCEFSVKLYHAMQLPWEWLTELYHYVACYCCWSAPCSRPHVHLSDRLRSVLLEKKKKHVGCMTNFFKCIHFLSVYLSTIHIYVWML